MRRDEQESSRLCYWGLHPEVRWSEEGIEDIRDSPSHCRYPGQMDEGFGRVEGSEDWRAKDGKCPELYGGNVA